MRSLVLCFFLFFGAGAKNYYIGFSPCKKRTAQMYWAPLDSTNQVSPRQHGPALFYFFILDELTENALCFEYFQENSCVLWNSVDFTISHPSNLKIYIFFAY